MKSRLTLCSTFLALFIQESQGQKDNPKKCFSPCPAGWELEEERCYLWTDIKKTWNEAERYCNDNDGHLASMTSRNIHSYILSKAKSRDKKQEGHWIGGRYLEQEERWRWSDESKWEFTRWGAGQPNNADAGDQHCLIVYSKYALDGWNDVPCEVPALVCYVKTITQTTQTILPISRMKSLEEMNSQFWPLLFR